MKQYKLLLSAAALAVAVSCTSESFAKDLLMVPGDVNQAPLNWIEESVTVQAPNTDVIEVVEGFAGWYHNLDKKLYNHESGRVVSGKQLFRERMLRYINLRVKFYEDSHRWKNDSYANVKLYAMQDEMNAVMTPIIKERIRFLDPNNKPSVHKTENMVSELYRIENEHMRNVYLSEVRYYANEILVFSITEAMKDVENTSRYYPPTIE